MLSLIGIHLIKIFHRLHCSHDVCNTRIPPAHFLQSLHTVKNNQDCLCRSFSQLEKITRVSHILFRNPDRPLVFADFKRMMHCKNRTICMHLILLFSFYVFINYSINLYSTIAYVKKVRNHKVIVYFIQKRFDLIHTYKDKIRKMIKITGLLLLWCFSKLLFKYLKLCAL